MGTIDDLEIEPSVPLQSLDSSGLPALTPEQSRQAIDLVTDSPEVWPDWTLAEGPEFLPAKPLPRSCRGLPHPASGTAVFRPLAALGPPRPASRDGLE
jgi:hypothetical protein